MKATVLIALLLCITVVAAHAERNYYHRSHDKQNSYYRKGNYRAHYHNFGRFHHPHHGRSATSTGITVPLPRKRISCHAPHCAHPKC